MKAIERIALASLVAKWEWSDDITASGARSRYECAEELLKTVDIPEDDLTFARGVHLTEMAGYVGDGSDDENYDAVSDFFIDYIDEHGYQALCNLIEEEGLKEVAQRAFDKDFRPSLD